LAGLAPFGLAIFVFGLAFVIGSAPSLCVALALTLFQSGLGRKNGSQASLPALELGWNFQIGFVILCFVGPARLLHQCGDLCFEPGFCG
jgi:hypothetical protein